METQSLLTIDTTNYYGTSSQNQSPTQRKRIGLYSATFIIFNSIIGTGIFATPATVLAFSGSIGLSLCLWVFGAIIAATGMQVYIVWGTAIPRNGGEKNYLEYLLPAPRYLITWVYAINTALAVRAAGNCAIFGDYITRVIFAREPSRLALNLSSFACITFCSLLHGTAFKWGLRIQNGLGVFKIFVAFMVVVTGFVALRDGLSGSSTNNDRWRGRKNFEHIWEGTTASASSICLSLYSVIYSFVGFSNANYALSEIHNPARTLRIAGPLAVAVVALLYTLANVAYFSGGSKEEIASSGRLVVSLLMKNVWGDYVERWVDIGIVCSALGAVLALSFVQARLIQELGKEGVLPFSKFFGSDKPFDTPLAGFGLHWFLCSIVIFIVPPGDAFNLIINLTMYPMAVVNVVVSFGLIFLFYSSFSTSKRDDHPWHHLSLLSLLSAIFFGAANVFLTLAPFVKPPVGAEPYKHLPYWIHAVAGWLAFAIGAVGWIVKHRKTLS